MDLYATGVLLYRMAAGQLPFGGSTQREIIDRILEGNPPPPAEVNPKVSKELSRVILKALSVDPDDAVDLARAVACREGLRVRGLMGMPPLEAEPETYFELLARLRDELRKTPEGAGATELSMGMTGDYEIAVEEGSTLVRIGTGIFR